MRILCGTILAIAVACSRVAFAGAEYPELPQKITDETVEAREARMAWWRPIPSRWDNVTCSTMSADPEKVMAARRETAERLYEKIADPTVADAKTIMALGEVISYANEGKYCASFWRALEAYRAKPGDRKEVDSINRTLDVLIRGKVIPESAKIETVDGTPACAKP
jgi:hypothetical protein